MRDGDLELAAFVCADAPAVDALLAEPAVRRWWPDGSYEHDSGWVVRVGGGEIAGWVQYQEETYEWYPSVGMDIALATVLHGCGYGRRVLSMVIEHFAARGHHRFTIDPNAANERAIRCYAAVGFQAVGVMRAYERDPGGGWSDALLMDLVIRDGQRT